MKPADPKRERVQLSKKYATTLAALEASAHVPVGEQTSEHPEPPPPTVVSPDEVERLTMLRIAGAP